MLTRLLEIIFAAFSSLAQPRFSEPPKLYSLLATPFPIIRWPVSLPGASAAMSFPVFPKSPYAPATEPAKPPNSPHQYPFIHPVHTNSQLKYFDNDRRSEAHPDDICDGSKRWMISCEFPMIDPSVLNSRTSVPQYRSDLLVPRYHDRVLVMEFVVFGGIGGYGIDLFTELVEIDERGAGRFNDTEWMFPSVIVEVERAGFETQVGRGWLNSRGIGGNVLHSRTENSPRTDHGNAIRDMADRILYLVKVFIHWKWKSRRSLNGYGSYTSKLNIRSETNDDDWGDEEEKTGYCGKLLLKVGVKTQLIDNPDQEVLLNGRKVDIIEACARKLDLFLESCMTDTFSQDPSSLHQRKAEEV